MSHRRQLVYWIVLALAAVVLLGFILSRQRDTTQRRFAIAVAARPEQGRVLFRDKGCATCHGEDASGSNLGPGLRGRASLTSLPQLVTAMWNHAPRMYDAMRKANLPYPSMTYDDTGQLAGYLYITGFTDRPGDPERGRASFAAKQCTRCHSAQDTGRGPTLAVLARSDSPISFTQALWNHAAAMQTELARSGLSWPRLQASELRDMFAYIRQARGNEAVTPEPTPDPDRGWRVFQEKSCLDCHALKKNPNNDAGQTARPVLGADGNLPPTFSEFGEALLNHFPDMHRAMSNAKKSTPVFRDGEMADLTVFVYSLRYLEPAGSPHVGSSVFGWRGCAECHGADAEGSTRGPALRGRGQTYTAVRLATDLWRHGSGMYEESRKTGHVWPMLQESDVGDLLSFLNTPVESRKQ